MFIGNVWPREGGYKVITEEMLQEWRGECVVRISYVDTEVSKNCNRTAVFKSIYSDPG